MGGLSPIHWLVVMLMLALFLLGPTVGFIMLLSHPKTRKGTLIVLPAVLLVVVLLVAGLFFARLSHTVVSQPEPMARTPATPVANGSADILMKAYESVQESLRAPGDSTAPPPRVENVPPTMPADAAAKREDEVSEAAASKAVSVLRAVARVLGRALAEEEKILAAKKDAAKPNAEKADGDGTQSALSQGEKERNQRPAWVGAPAQLVGDAYQMTINIGPYTTRAECDAKLPEELQAALGRYVEACLGDQATRDISLPTDYLRQQLVKAEWQEVRPYSVGPMTQLHVLLQFDRKVKDRVLEAYRESAVADRLQAVAGWAAIALSLLTICFAYLKTDLTTGGLYRGRLRFAAGVAILGLVVVAVAWMA